MTITILCCGFCGAENGPTVLRCGFCCTDFRDVAPRPLTQP
jgi:hypothetical protein